MINAHRLSREQLTWAAVAAVPLAVSQGVVLAVGTPPRASTASPAAVEQPADVNPSAGLLQSDARWIAPAATPASDARGEGDRQAFAGKAAHPLGPFVRAFDADDSRDTGGAPALPTLTAVIIGRIPHAMLDGEMVRPGDRHSSGWNVAAIDGETRSVIIERPGDGRVRLAIQRPELER